MSVVHASRNRKIHSITLIDETFVRHKADIGVDQLMENNRKFTVE